MSLGRWGKYVQVFNRFLSQNQGNKGLGQDRSPRALPCHRSHMGSIVSSPTGSEWWILIITEWNRKQLSVEGKRTLCSRERIDWPILVQLFSGRSVHEPSAVAPRWLVGTRRQQILRTDYPLDLTLFLLWEQGWGILLPMKPKTVSSRPRRMHSLCSHQVGAGRTVRNWCPARESGARGNCDPWNHCYLKVYKTSGSF